jgi:hypothetical protein
MQKNYSIWGDAVCQIAKSDVEKRKREDKERFRVLSLRLSQKIHDIPIESLWRFDRGQVADAGIGQEFGALNVCAQVLTVSVRDKRIGVPVEDKRGGSDLVEPGTDATPSHHGTELPLIGFQPHRLGLGIAHQLR